MSKNDKKTISQKMNDLSELVAWFESDDFVLEEAINQYKAAEKLAEDIQNDLSELKNEVNVLKQKFDS